MLAGADAVEIGIPFSDPMMDGPVIQEAALRALAAGTTFDSICDDLESARVAVPLIAMTYYNIVLHYGLERARGQTRYSRHSAVRSCPTSPRRDGVRGRRPATTADVATVLLVAPSTPAERVARLAAASEGFVYASARMAVTGRSPPAEGEGARVVQSIRARR